MRRIAGLLWRPRSTMAALVAAPQFLATWLLVLGIWLGPAVWLLSTDVGRQALVDERVRVIEAFGGVVDDAQYETLRQAPPWSGYFTSGGRALLAPPVTFLVAVGLIGLARMDRASLSLAGALAVTVHATVVLAVQQALVTPLLYLRESISSPTSLAALVPAVEDGTMAARLLGVIDVFGVWWLWLLALGVSAATGRPARRYLGRLLAVYAGLAAVIAAVMALRGGF